MLSVIFPSRKYFYGDFFWFSSFKKCSRSLDPIGKKHGTVTTLFLDPSFRNLLNEPEFSKVPEAGARIAFNEWSRSFDN